jgi:hypothetical protein
MAEPDGPTGVITLKQIADMTYEQYGAIVLRETGLTQVTASAEARTLLFQPNIEQQVTWIEEFAARIQGAPNPSQSSPVNAQEASWPGGAWGMTLTPQALLDGAVRYDTAGVTGNTELQTDETQGLQKATSHVNRNPTFYMRFAHAGGTDAGIRGIGWHRGGESFATEASAKLGAINFRWQNGGTLIAVCSRNVAGVGQETTMSTGVTMATGSYHTGRAVVTGAGAAVEFFVDGVSKGSITTTIPDEAPGPGGTFQLTPGVGSTNGPGDVMDVDYMACSQQRTA